MERMILISNSDNRRTVGLQAARARLGLPPAIQLGYLDLLQGKTSLTHLAHSQGLQIGEAPMLRLDAPGEDFEVERELIALGAPDANCKAEDDRLMAFGGKVDFQSLSMKTARALHEQKGKLYHPSQWFRGYGRLLARMDNEAKQLWKHPRWMNAPADIAAMFDKRETHRVLSAAGLPVPRLLDQPEALLDYEMLREKMASLRMHRIFLKLAAGSGACGVMAYQVNPVTGAELAITTIGVENYIARPPLYYNVKKLVRYTDRPVIRQIVNWLLHHGAHVEQWIPKASYEDRAFDIRQLVVGGEACHSIARVSSTPITNLHLRSERMSLESVNLSMKEQEGVRLCAEKAMEAFPNSEVAGIDIALSRGTRTPYVLDVNPFGDLIYHVNYRGYDTYEWEFKRLGAFQDKRERKSRVD
ncbi:hypothetical protein GK047_06960 [Paenibacillus sp. SYP-B3998]|uniref:ATP-grasp domain-containing protein n=1 Tax=Paenibacillus sp. SYP-B3998 TaxID=2678564 RepID=A0A6G3ZUP1_9BACL|nr:STM4014 family protein [Paenibacillus sp. SYP-B3998]NEW05758.1 hypothetical protein [Paenibacillus sp. SYP-B3998]